MKKEMINRIIFKKNICIYQKDDQDFAENKNRVGGAKLLGWRDNLCFKSITKVSQSFIVSDCPIQVHTLTNSWYSSTHTRPTNGMQPMATYRNHQLLARSHPQAEGNKSGKEMKRKPATLHFFARFISSHPNQRPLGLQGWSGVFASFLFTEVHNYFNTILKANLSRQNMILVAFPSSYEILKAITYQSQCLCCGRGLPWQSDKWLSQL